MKAMRGWGAVLLLAGAALTFYFFFLYDTSVPTKPIELFGQTNGGDRVHNLGLMENRRNHRRGWELPPGRDVSGRSCP